MMLIDKEIVKKRFGRSVATYNQHATVQQRICAKLAGCLQKYTNQSFNHLLEIGCGSGLLTAEVLRLLSLGHYVVNDLVSDNEALVAQVFGQYPAQLWQFLEGDAEAIDFQGTFDGIISTSTVQWFNDLPAFFDKVHQALADNGVFAFSTFGPQNFWEIRQTLNQGLQYPAKPELLDMLAKNFDVVCSCDYLEPMYFRQPIDVLKHIRFTGVNGIGTPCWNRTKLREFEEKYVENSRHLEMKGVELTYHPIIIIAKKKA